jgi:hypothetical protein
MGMVLMDSGECLAQEAPVYWLRASLLLRVQPVNATEPFFRILHSDAGAVGAKRIVIIPTNATKAT